MLPAVPVSAACTCTFNGGIPNLWTLDCRLSAGLRAGSGGAGAVAVPRNDQAQLQLTARGPRYAAVRISAKAEYACLAVIALAQRRPENRPVPIREIAEAQGIPETFLTQILLKLKGAGLVLSTRGSAGGYRLARSPEEISLLDVLRVVDGSESERAGVPRSSRSASGKGLGADPGVGNPCPDKDFDRSTGRAIESPMTG